MKTADHIIGEPDNNSDEVNSGSFTDLLFRQISVHGEDISQIDALSGKCETFGGLHEKSKIVAASMVKIGVFPGEIIAIACENRLEYSTVMLASMLVGSIAAPISPTLTPEEIAHVLGIIKPRLIFCSDYNYRNISLGISLSRWERMCQVVLFGEFPLNPLASTITYNSLFQTSPIENAYKSKDSDVAVILTSSGTTGLPKGVMLSYRNLRYFCSCAVSHTFMNLNSKDIILGLLPLYHGYGYGLLLASFVVGIKFVLLPKFEEKMFLQTIEKYKITNLYLVPPLLTFLGKHPLVTQYNLSSVREVVCGAAPLSYEVLVQAQERLPHADFRQGYGMTETSVVITITPPYSKMSQSVGKLAVGLQAKVINIHTGKTQQLGQQGELLVRGPCVMVGYCRDPKATKQTVDSEGWLHTGDIGFIDNGGFFYIVDRIKELIKYKGFQVAPAELESLLLGMPGVKDAAVVGLPDPTAGELPVAYVVLQPNSPHTDKSIMNYVNEKVSPHKRLRSVTFVESVPRNPSGKILRRILRKTLNSKL